MCNGYSHSSADQQQQSTGGGGGGGGGGAVDVDLWPPAADGGFSWELPRT